MAIRSHDTHRLCPFACAQVRLLFLPAYSPELNPAECLFGIVKTYLRNHRTSRPFLAELVDAFAHITWQNVADSYRHCLTL